MMGLIYITIDIVVVSVHRGDKFFFSFIWLDSDLTWSLWSGPHLTFRRCSLIKPLFSIYYYLYCYFFSGLNIKKSHGGVIMGGEIKCKWNFHYLITIPVPESTYFDVSINIRILTFFCFGDKIYKTIIQFASWARSCPEKTIFAVIL